MKILILFYDSVVESAWWRYCLLCFGRDVSKGDRERLDRIVKEAGKIVGVPRQDFESVCTDLLIKKLPHVVDDVSHPLHAFQVIWLPYQGACFYCLPRIFLASFLRQFGNVNYKRGDDQFECSCLLYYFFLSACVCNFHFECNKVLLDLTWLWPVGKKCLILFKTPSFSGYILQTLVIWDFHFKFLSIVISKNLAEETVELIYTHLTQQFCYFENIWSCRLCLWALNVF